MLITQAGGPRGQCGFSSKNRVQVVPQPWADSSEGTGLGFLAGSAPSLPLALCQKWPSRRVLASRGAAPWSLHRAAPSTDPVITALSIPVSPEGKRPWAQWRLGGQSFLLSPRLGSGAQGVKATLESSAISPPCTFKEKLRRLFRA